MGDRIRIPPDLRTPIDRFKESRTGEVTDEDVIAAALQRFLVEEGFLSRQEVPFGKRANLQASFTHH